MFFFSPILDITIILTALIMLFGNYNECKLLIKISTKLDKLLEAKEIRAMDIMIKRAHFKWNKPRLIRLVDRQLDLLLGTNQSRIYFSRSFPFVNTISSEMAYRRLLRKLKLYKDKSGHLSTILMKRKYRSQIIFISPVLLECNKRLDAILRDETRIKTSENTKL